MAETIEEIVNGNKVIKLEQLQYVKQYTDQTFVAKDKLGDGFNIDETTGEITVDITGAQINTTAGWNAQSTLISGNGTIYIYSDYKTVDGKNIPNIKIGDGTSYLSALPFAFTDSTHAADTDIHVTADDKTKWNNKATYSMNDSTETLTLTKD